MARRRSDADLDVFDGLNSSEESSPAAFWAAGPALVATGALYVAIRLRQGPIGIGSTAVGALGFGAAAYVFAQDPPSPKLGDALALTSAVVLAAGQAHVFRTRRSMMTIHLLTVSGAALVYFGSRATVDLVELAAKQSRTSAER